MPHNMMFVRLLFWLVLLAVSSPVTADPPLNYPFLSYDEGLRTAHREGKRIFLYFGRHGCGWCDLTNKQAFSNADLRRRFIENYVLVYVDAESGKRLSLPNGERITEMELGVRFKAFATPIFVYLEPDGAVIFKVTGIQTTKDFNNYDRYVRKGIYKTKDIRQFLAENP